MTERLHSSGGECDVGAVEQIPADRFRIVDIDGVEVGVGRIAGELFAVRNVCPHQGSPICRGKVRGTLLPSGAGELEYGLEGRVLVCHWHQYEFSLDTGRALFTNIRGRLRLYPVEQRAGRVIVDLKRHGGQPG